jgi:hypothetical protein
LGAVARASDGGSGLRGGGGDCAAGRVCGGEVAANGAALAQKLEF